MYTGETTLRDAQFVRPARQLRVQVRRRTFGYIENLDDASTPLADFFSILLVAHLHEQI